MEADLEERGGTTLFVDMELPLVDVLARMETAGILVDRDYLVDLGNRLRGQLVTLESDIHGLAGEPFNVNSTLQLRKVLFEDLELPVLKKTSKGAPSTDASVLAKLEEAHPIVAKLLRYRELDKLRGTYVDGYLPLIQPDGRIHAYFNQIAAATGRLSSDRPNMQNIPVRSETGLTIRRAFIPRPGGRSSSRTTHRSNSASLRTCRSTPACCTRFAPTSTCTRQLRLASSDSSQTWLLRRCGVGPRSSTLVCSTGWKRLDWQIASKSRATRPKSTWMHILSNSRTCVSSWRRS